MRPALIAALLACAAPAAAQPSPEPKGGKLTIPLALSPTAEPRPTSRFLLQPQYTDLMPGEKLAGFLKCFMEQAQFFSPAEEKKRAEWNALPLADLPLDQIRQQGVLDGIAYDPPYARLMVFMDQAARYNRVEWNLWYNLRNDGLNTLLPEVQKLRSIAQVLKLRMRAEIKAGEFARAAETSKTLFGLARMLEQAPTLVSYLVAIAVASVAVDALEEMVQQPGCPNLYWGLTDLGAPVLDIRTGAGGERVWLASLFRPALDATGPLSDEQLAVVFRRIDGLYESEGPKPKKDVPPPPSAQYKKLAADAKFVDAARAFLVETGSKPEVVKSYTPLQAVFIADIRHLEASRDDGLRTLSLPLWQAEPLARAIDDDLKKHKAEGTLVLAPELVPAVLRVRQRSAALDQRVAYLRVIEAIRLYAHDNNGRLPTSLDDIKLPLPPDPVTGKPFEYAVRGGGVAVLRGGNAGTDRGNREYEITVRK
ncbi:MAG: hypothetical protein J2P46_20815 [Zavarzinella sp.]|nr:hypothetical protein [Zavarzinella sp.]